MTTPDRKPESKVYDEPHYTPQEVGKILQLDPETVIRLFRKEAGILEWGSDETLHKRKRKFIRIPKSVLERFHETHRALKPTKPINRTNRI